MKRLSVVLLVVLMLLISVGRVTAQSPGLDPEMFDALQTFLANAAQDSGLHLTDLGSGWELLLPKDPALWPFYARFLGDYASKIGSMEGLHQLIRAAGGQPIVSDGDATTYRFPKLSDLGGKGIELTPTPSQTGSGGKPLPEAEKSNNGTNLSILLLAFLAVGSLTLMGRRVALQRA